MCVDVVHDTKWMFYVDNGVCWCTSVHHELHKQEFIQCEDWMLTGPTSNAFHLIGYRSTKKTSRRFTCPNSSITASEFTIMIEIGEKFGRGRELRRGGWGVWSGVFPSPVELGSGEGAVPPPQKIYDIFAWKWRILVAFFAICEIFSQFKGGGHGPSGPMVSTPLLELDQLVSIDNMLVDAFILSATLWRIEMNTIDTFATAVLQLPAHRHSQGTCWSSGSLPQWSEDFYLDCWIPTSSTG